MNNYIIFITTAFIALVLFALVIGYLVKISKQLESIKREKEEELLKVWLPRCRPGFSLLDRCWDTIYNETYSQVPMEFSETTKEEWEKKWESLAKETFKARYNSNEHFLTIFYDRSISVDNDPFLKEMKRQYRLPMISDYDTLGFIMSHKEWWDKIGSKSQYFGGMHGE